MQQGKHPTIKKVLQEKAEKRRRKYEQQEKKLRTKTNTKSHRSTDESTRTSSSYASRKIDFSYCSQTNTRNCDLDSSGSDDSQVNNQSLHRPKSSKEVKRTNDKKTTIQSDDDSTADSILYLDMNFNEILTLISSSSSMEILYQVSVYLTNAIRESNVAIN